MKKPCISEFQIAHAIPSLEWRYHLDDLLGYLKENLKCRIYFKHVYHQY